MQAYDDINGYLEIARNNDEVEIVYQGKIDDE